MRPLARLTALSVTAGAAALAGALALAPVAAAAPAPSAVASAPAVTGPSVLGAAAAVPDLPADAALSIRVAGQRPAEPPVDVGTRQIDDQAGVGADTGDARSALDELRSQAHINLYVVLVDSFDGADKQTWASQSFSQSDLGSNDVLLAIATGDRRFGFQAGVTGQPFPLTESAVNTILNNQAAPHMSSGDWSGAIVAAADGMRAAVANGGNVGSGNQSGGSGTSSTGSLAWIWLVVLLGVGVIAFLWIRAYRRRQASEQQNKKNAGPPPEPYEHLSNRSVNALIQTDNAVQASEGELQLAEGEFGTQATAEFRAAHDQAKALLTKAFQLRQEIDDEIPEDEATRRGWMTQIIQLCQQASDGLAAQTSKFEQLRDLKSRLPQVLSSLPAEIDAQANRLPQAAATLQRLSGAYSEQALATVAGNTDQANERLQFARNSLEEANASASGTGGSDGTDDGSAVLAARAAQEAVRQATTLLDAIDRLDHDLAAAAARLGAARDHVTQELADARAALTERSAGAATAELQQRLAAVQATLQQANSAEAGRDPVNSLKKLNDADHALDDILASTRSAQQQEKRARSALENELVTAQSTVSAVDDYISTRRGAVNSTARTRLAEARRHLAQAHALADSDAKGALAEAEKATDLARQAYQEAHDDIDRWYGGPGRRSSMGGVGGALLGGILIGSLLDGNHRGGWGGGGWGGGGFGGGWGGGGGGFGGGGSFGGGGGGFGGGGSF